MQVVVGYIAG